MVSRTKRNRPLVIIKHDWDIGFLVWNMPSDSRPEMRFRLFVYTERSSGRFTVQTVGVLGPFCSIRDVTLFYVQKRGIPVNSDSRLSVEVTAVPAYSNCTVTVAARYIESRLWGPGTYISFITPPQGMSCTLCVCQL